MTTTDLATAIDVSRLPDLEAWLNDNGISWCYEPSFPLADIDQGAGLRNQARLEPIDDDVVERYAADMLGGARFPAIILRVPTLFEQPTGAVPIGGNHRAAAAWRVHRKTHPAYLVTVTDEQAHLLAIEDNRRHGLPLTDEERLWHAVTLVQSGEHTATDAARICGLPAHKLHRQLEANRGAARAIRLEVDGWPALSVTSRAKVGSIRHDGLFARVVHLLAKGGIPASELSDIVARINGADDIAQATELVDALELDARHRTRRSSGHPVSKLRAPATRLLHDLDGILAYAPADVAGDCRGPDQRARLARQIKAAARRLMAIDQELWK